MIDLLLNSWPLLVAGLAGIYGAWQHKSAKIAKVEARHAKAEATAQAYRADLQEKLAKVAREGEERTREEVRAEVKRSMAEGGHFQ